jgi:hypothetical protein
VSVEKHGHAADQRGRGGEADSPRARERDESACRCQLDLQVDVDTSVPGRAATVMGRSDRVMRRRSLFGCGVGL